MNIKKFLKNNKTNILLTAGIIYLFVESKKTMKENGRLRGIIENQQDEIKGYKRVTERMIFNAGKNSRTPL
jgi:hypothetical protein